MKPLLTVSVPLLFGLLLAGCPFSSEDVSPTGPASAGPGAPGPAGMGGMGGEPGGPGGAGGGPPGDGGPKLSELVPSKTQEEIRGGPHVTLRGEVSGSCAAPIRLDLLAPPDGEVSGSPPGPLTTATLPAPGSFEMVAPAGQPGRLVALCDGDQDDRISSSADGMSPPAELDDLSADQQNILLTLAPPRGPGGPPSEGEGAGGPPPDGAGGPPPQGAGGPVPGGPAPGGPP